MHLDRAGVGLVGHRQILSRQAILPRLSEPTVRRELCDSVRRRQYGTTRKEAETIGL